MQREVFRKTTAGLIEQVAAPMPAPAPPAELIPVDLAAARTRALTTLKDALSVHMGRKLADRLSREIAHGP